MLGPTTGLQSHLVVPDGLRQCLAIVFFDVPQVRSLIAKVVIYGARDLLIQGCNPALPFGGRTCLGRSGTRARALGRHLTSPSGRSRRERTVAIVRLECERGCKRIMQSRAVYRKKRAMHEQVTLRTLFIFPPCVWDEWCDKVCFVFSP
jgi:hypothetical protein